MKKIYRLISAALSLALMISLTFAGSPVAQADTFFEEGDFRFAVTSGDVLMLAGYSGAEAAVTLPGSVNGRAIAGVYKSCFENATVTSVAIPEGYTSIGAFAFSGCEQLTEISLPPSLETIGLMAFYGCSALSDIDLSVSTDLRTIGMSAFSGCSSLTDVNLPDELTAIGESAFSGCTQLASVHLPDALTDIGDYAFYGDTSLAAIDFPLTLNSIGESAFENDTALGGVFLPDSVSSIGDNAFAPMVTDAAFTVQCFEETAAAEYFTALETGNLSVYQKLTGDVNLDGTLTVVDVTLIQKYIADLEPLDHAALRDLADIDRNGEINIADATAGQRKIAGYEDDTNPMNGE